MKWNDYNLVAFYDVGCSRGSTIILIKTRRNVDLDPGEANWPRFARLQVDIGEKSHTGWKKFLESSGLEPEFSELKSGAISTTLWQVLFNVYFDSNYSIEFFSWTYHRQTDRQNHRWTTQRKIMTHVRHSVGHYRAQPRRVRLPWVKNCSCKVSSFL